MMRGGQIKYQTGYKYQLAEDYSIQTVITGHEINLPLIALHMDGLLTIKKGMLGMAPADRPLTQNHPCAAHWSMTPYTN